MVNVSRAGPPHGIEVHRGGTLMERALRLLADGPTSTAEVAGVVFGMRGNASAAAAAVWTLLADDPRFSVSSAGVWSLRAAGGADGAETGRLRDESWVVVDVETTGGTPSTGHRVTEVAAVWVTRGEIGEVFSTLVNPERSIPSMVSRLTGITNAMVRSAPRFREIADSLARALDGRVFVAHNAAFDWRFLCAELELERGARLQGRHLCTVRLARKLLPQLPSRSLDALADYFDLRITARHRAEGDAIATASLLTRLIGMLEDRGIADWAGLEAVLGRRRASGPRRRRPRSMDRA